MHVVTLHINLECGLTHKPYYAPIINLYIKIPYTPMYSIMYMYIIVHEHSEYNQAPGITYMYIYMRCIYDIARVQCICEGGVTTTYNGVDIGVVFQEALHYLHQPPLTGQVQGRVESSPRRPRSGGTVDICSVSYQEAGRGRVVEDDGSV